MATSLAIIHTTPATVSSLKALAEELIPDVEVINFVDDSILPQLARNGGDLTAVEGRLVAYARFAEEVGADIILEACSSVGELVETMQASVSVPVVRIDTAMATEAVHRGKRIGIAATLATTLDPTTRLIHQSARASGKEVAVRPLLIEGAFQKLEAGDRAGHDQMVVDALLPLAEWADVVVLAQASMAGVVPRLPANLQGRFLTSPRSGMMMVREVAQSTQGDR